ncbi:NAD(P)-dependent oxidoreductase [Octadecabacter sp.]|nr:NAD(P)-dependent oxidoreductase [Octadecabacter sp.]
MATDTMRVGVVGLGQMGRGIAHNLEGAGLLGAVCDIDDAATGGFAARSLFGQDLVDACDVIMFAVPSTAQIANTISGCSGANTLLVDLTTSDPALSAKLANDVAQRGFNYIDAAMTGGAAGADAGTLTLMVGGASDHFDTCQPIFDAIAKQIFHLGPVGSGHAMKLVHNLILHSSFMATCEGLRLARRAGLDVNAAVDVLNAGNARSFVTEVRFPRDILSGSMNARSTIANLQKDLGLAVDFAATLEGPAPYTALTSQLLNTARDRGQAQTDFSHLFRLFDDLAHPAEPTL